MKITNKDPNFYSILGPIFGSRKVQRETGDRFYDDEEKEWYVELNDYGEAISVVSITNTIIKNVYSTDENSLEKLLCEIYLISSASIIPAIYKEIYVKAGFIVEDGSLKNFVKIQGGNVNGAIFV